MYSTIDDYLTKRLDERPREVCFYAPAFFDNNGQPQSVKVCARLEKGNVAKVIKNVKRKGGIGGTDESGLLRFVMWPPAIIEVRDL